MTDLSKLSFIDNNAAVARPEKFMDALVIADKTVESWRYSVFSFEWLNKDGSIKNIEELSPREQPKRAEVERMIAQGNALPKPILGIGLEDNIEIGSGREVFLTLKDLGLQVIPVHIPVSNAEDFKDYLANG